MHVAYAIIMNKLRQYLLENLIFYANKLAAIHNKSNLKEKKKKKKLKTYANLHLK